MVAWPFWALLLVVFGIAVAWRPRRGSTIESHAVRLAWPELSIGVLALLALAFHCLAMFLPPLVPPIQAVQGLPVRSRNWASSASSPTGCRLASSS